jgi:peptidoglycan/xylan/chitin deacetylase (PgdA/CDA1 family)
VNRRRLFFALLLVAVCFLAWFAFRSRELKYETLKSWLQRLDAPELSREDLECERARVRIALLGMGTNVFPHLTQLLFSKSGPSGLRRAITWFNGKQSLIQMPLDREISWPALASQGFGLLGTNAAPAIPRLADYFQQDQTCEEAYYHLLPIGPAALPVFVQALTNNSPVRRYLALEALGELGPAAGETIPLVCELARATNSQYSANAMSVLSEVDTNAGRHVPLFTSRLFDTNYTWDAAYALGKVGQDGVRPLLQALTNQHKKIRNGAAVALHTGTIGSRRDQTEVPAGPSQHFRQRCYAFDMEASGPIQKHKLASALTWVMMKTDADLQAMAVEHLALQGLAGAPGLSLARESTNPEVRRVGGTALEKLGVEVQGGAITRGRQTEKCLALVFTGHTFGEGGETILSELARHRAKGAFFLTGVFLTNQSFAPLLQRISKEDHLLGPHSDQHLLHCSWDQERRTLVSRQDFAKDLAANLQRLEYPVEGLDEAFRRRYGVGPVEGDTQSEAELFKPRERARYFLPPYEHYNTDIVLWSLDMGLILINYTPGTRSNADYTGEADQNFVSSQAILDSIVQKEREDPHGLNGFILLLHLGSGPGRADKFHTRFGELLDYLQGKGYEFVRVDELLEPKAEESQ